jgi:hypothetical protein
VERKTKKMKGVKWRFLVIREIIGATINNKQSAGAFQTRRSVSSLFCSVNNELNWICHSAPLPLPKFRLLSSPN